MIENMLSKFSMVGYRTSSTPLPPGLIADSVKGDIHQPPENVPYREVVGSLMHLANKTRPEIAFAARVLSRNLENPKQQHWNAIKQVLTYLKETKNHGRIYLRHNSKGETSLGLHGYSDSDFASDPKDRKSQFAV